MASTLDIYPGRIQTGTGSAVSLRGGAAVAVPVPSKSRLEQRRRARTPAEQAVLHERIVNTILVLVTLGMLIYACHHMVSCPALAHGAAPVSNR